MVSSQALTFAVCGNAALPSGIWGVVDVLEFLEGDVGELKHVVLCTFVVVDELAVGLELDGVAVLA